jgi:sugar lactone lactonase YvrE
VTVDEPVARTVAISRNPGGQPVGHSEREIVMSSKESSTHGLHTLLSGLRVGESPRWHDGRLWFAHWGASEVITVDDHGSSELMARPPSPFFSIDWLPDGRLLIISGRRLLRREFDGSIDVHVELADISEYGWNEIVVDGRGNIYLNNPGFDLMSGQAPKLGSIGLVTPEGVARPAAHGLAFPNGMAVTADNSTLIVAESYARQLSAFDIAEEGGLSNRRVWADLDEGVPDGICLDAEEAVWYADVPNQRCVRVREGGQVLQSIEIDRGCFACMLGGDDRTTLFMMAAEWRGPANMFDEPRTGQVLTVDVAVPGAGWP